MLADLKSVLLEESLIGEDLDISVGLVACNGYLIAHIHFLAGTS